MHASYFVNRESDGMRCVLLAALPWSGKANVHYPENKLSPFTFVTDQ